jgi:FAD/FMN-containing dehydrogenase
MTWTSELTGEVQGQVLTDEGSRAAVSTDFGRLVVRKPEAVVRPAYTEDVARVARFAARHRLTLSTRGGGHSQTGQSLSNHIVVDMTSLSAVRRVDEKSGVVVCQGGLAWRSLVEQLAPKGVSPPVLTNNLDVTVGGTLSTAGLGVASWRHGTQADNCLALEVVTGAGEIVRCSPEENRELFDAVRAGMGQFGVITEATLRIRRHKPKTRTLYLLYDDLAAILGDLKTVMTDERFDYLESWCAPLAQGFKNAGGQRQAFAEWFFPLHATVEFDEAAPEAEEKLKGLKFYKHTHTEDAPIHDFFSRLDAVFALWKRGGFWEYTHPWMECVLPWQTTPMYLNQLLANLPPQVVVGGHILMWPARGTASTVPLFMRPAGDFVMGFGILPAIRKDLVEEVLPRLNMASAASMMMGGRRYLSGWIAFDPTQWKAHFGEKWPAVVALKKKYDPQGVLNPGFIRYE